MNKILRMDDFFKSAWTRRGLIDGGTRALAAGSALSFMASCTRRDRARLTHAANVLGISARNDSTLVVTLNEPAPYLPEWLQHQTTWPVPQHVVMAKGYAWSRPENYVANGPYIPASWVPNDRVVLTKNPTFFDAKSVRISTVNYFPTQDNQAALKQMLAGELDIQEPFPIGAIDWLRRNMPRELDIRANLSNSYL